MLLAPDALLSRPTGTVLGAVCHAYDFFCAPPISGVGPPLTTAQRKRSPLCYPDGNTLLFHAVANSFRKVGQSQDTVVETSALGVGDVRRFAIEWLLVLSTVVWT